MNYTELTMLYRETDRDLTLFSQKINGQSEEDFIPNNENIAKAKKELEILRKTVESLPDEDKVAAVVKHHFIDFTDSLEYQIDDAKNHPEKYFMGFNWSIDYVSRLGLSPDKEKCESLLKYPQKVMSKKDILVELIKERNNENGLYSVGYQIEYDSEILTKEIDRLSKKFPQCPEDIMNEFRNLLTEFVEMQQNIAKELMEQGTPSQKISDDLNKIVKFGEEEYRVLLKKKLGVSLDELLSWHKEEMEKTRAEVFEIASKLDIPEKPKTMQEINEILFKYEGPCESAEEMFERANMYLKRTRALAHEYVDLPDDEFCKCVDIPDSCKDSYPWGGYEGGDFSVRPFHGQMFLNQYNFKNINDGWIKLNSLHEAYPGHHVQYIKTAISERPETTKIGAKYIPVLEGTCLRTERAFEFIFAEDDFFPLFVAYRRHHAAVRICVDLMLYYYGLPLKDAVELYEKELGFDRVTARGQVQAHQNQPGYFTCYYYGMKKLCGWEKEYGFDKKEFSEILFSAGYISIDTFGELVKLSLEDRQRYYKDFCSLLKEEIKTIK